jgi:hypothetical protein
MWASASRLTDDGCRAPSLLPGWSRGHVLAHWARNADGQTRMLQAAMRGEVAAQYPGGDAQRAADIETGAARPAPLILHDVRAALDRVEDAWRQMPPEAWSRPTGARIGQLRLRGCRQRGAAGWRLVLWQGPREPLCVAGYPAAGATRQLWFRSSCRRWPYPVVLRNHSCPGPPSCSPRVAGGRRPGPPGLCGSAPTGPRYWGCREPKTRGCVPTRGGQRVPRLFTAPPRTASGSHRRKHARAVSLRSH